MQDQDLNLGKCIGDECTNRVASMAVCYSGATAKRKNCQQKSTVTHCIFSRERFATQKLSPELNDVMIRAVKIINYL